MIFSVRNNSMALNTMRNLQKASCDMGKSMEKLSSGFRINTAADGPADLIASEQLRARIEGLECAIRAARTAGNVMDIADSALGEVNGIIANMRKLAIHAMNSGVITAEQTAANQAEMDAGLQAIDRIISTTNYAGRKLLDSLNLRGQYDSGGTVTIGGKSVAAADIAQNAGSLPDRDLPDAGGLPGNRDGILPANTEPLVDADGKLLADKTFNIIGRDGAPETVETVGFAAGTSLADMVAKLREYAIAPEQTAGLDPGYAPPSVRFGDDINRVALDLDALAHLGGVP